MPRIKNLKLNNNSIVDFPTEILSDSNVNFIEFENNALSEDKFRSLDGYDKVRIGKKNKLKKIIIIKLKYVYIFIII